MFDISQLGERIRASRRRLGLTQSGLAEKMNVSFQAISSWETGTTLPDIGNLCRLSTLFGVSVDSLLKGHPNDENCVMIGVDGGGTKCEFALFTPSGRILKNFRLPATNAGVTGLDEAVRILSHGIDLCITECPGVSGVFIGNAGSRLDEILRRLAERYPKLSISIDSDAVNALSSADGDAALICGTGSIMLIRTEDGYRRVGGWGSRLGDPGSAYNLGRAAIRAAYAYEDGISSDPLLYRMVIEKTGERRIRGRFVDKSVAYIASLASVIFDALRVGDETAQDIINEEMRELASVINSACPQGGRVNACGGMIEHFGDITLPLLKKHARSDITFIFPKLPPIYGACVECCSRMGIQRSEDFFEVFEEEYRKLQKN